MPAYKLFYFDARSHAEPIRLIFALAGVQYEDVRLCDDEWGILKESKLKFLEWQWCFKINCDPKFFFENSAAIVFNILNLTRSMLKSDEKLLNLHWLLIKILTF